MDGDININVSSVWGRTAEHADISPVDLFEQVAEKKQPYDQKRRIEQQIIGVNQPDRKMNIIVFGKKCGNFTGDPYRDIIPDAGSTKMEHLCGCIK